MTVRVRQLIQEIEALSADERKELEASLQPARVEPALRYVDRDEALQAADRIFADHAELFRKLAE